MKILLANDDGAHAPGLRALRKRLIEFAEVIVLAPVSEQSASAHGLTLNYPLIVQEVWEDGERIGYAVEGKPADCVKLGLVEFFGARPDLVVSGINAGANAGINVLYSGTVAAAIEGAFFNVTSIAVSLSMAQESQFDRAAAIAVNIIRQIVDHGPAPGELFNVNIPDLSKGDPLGVQVAPQALVCYMESYERRKDPRGRSYYWLLPDGLKSGTTLDSDLTALSNRFVTVTPLHFDLTAHARLEQLREWRWDLSLPD